MVRQTYHYQSQFAITQSAILNLSKDVIPDAVESSLPLGNEGRGIHAVLTAKYNKKKKNTKERKPFHSQLSGVPCPCSLFLVPCFSLYTLDKEPSGL
jgi:hypothetical protein